MGTAFLTGFKKKPTCFYHWNDRFRFQIEETQHALSFSLFSACKFLSWLIGLLEMLHVKTTERHPKQPSLLHTGRSCFSLWRGFLRSVRHSQPQLWCFCLNMCRIWHHRLFGFMLILSGINWFQRMTFYKWTSPINLRIWSSWAWHFLTALQGKGNSGRVLLRATTFNYIFKGSKSHVVAVTFGV